MDSEPAGPGTGRACVVAQVQQIGGRREVAAKGTCGHQQDSSGRDRGAAVGSQRRAGPIGRRQRFTLSLAYSTWWGVFAISSLARRFPTPAVKCGAHQALDPLLPVPGSL